MLPFQLGSAMAPPFQLYSPIPSELRLAFGAHLSWRVNFSRESEPFTKKLVLMPEKLVFAVRADLQIYFVRFVVVFSKSHVVCRSWNCDVIWVRAAHRAKFKHAFAFSVV